MDIERLRRSLIALSQQEGHYGSLNVDTVINMIEVRADIIEEYQRRDYEAAMEHRKEQRMESRDNALN